MILSFKFLHFCFQLVCHPVFILDKCSGLVKLPHQFHSKLNVALIFKPYLFIWFFRCFNVMADFIQVSLATIFYVSCPIFWWGSIIFCLFLSTIFFFSLRRSLRSPVVLFAASLIILISILIDKYFCIYDINLWHILTVCNAFFVSLFISVLVIRIILKWLWFSALNSGLWDTKLSSEAVE